ncbi:MAG: substrate-binding domain-containing protein, partial [Anaerolineae bacterium]|nr:substrate-binding domain-containing protein [Anaerolineae bacterium]
MKKRLLVLVLVLVLAFSGIVQAQDTYTIGVSNSFVGSEWRTQMIKQIEDAAAEIEELYGITIDLVIESTDTDVSGQVQQIQNLLNRGVDAIIVNPGDQTGLNLAIEEATDEGVVVIAVDQEIGAAGAINVVIDQKEWAMISAEWLAEQLGGEGSIVLIEGFVGHPANEARMAGVEEVLAEYPGIEVIGRESGMWDQATGQQVMSDFLASLTGIDGVWTQDGMASGVMTAIMDAGLENPPIATGEARASFLQMWEETLMENPDFTTIGVVNPPGIGASGLRVAIELLRGAEINEEAFSGPFGNTLYVPIPYSVTNENLQEVYDAQNIGEAPASFTLDGIITQEGAI